jgi:Family of unknown function (DUF6494)
MNEDVFNNSIRKFLKTLGVTAQREIEKAVRQALALPSPTRSKARSSWNSGKARALGSCREPLETV